MLDDALANLEGEIKPPEVGITDLQVVNRAKRLGIVVEAAVRAHQLVERTLACVSEWWMTQIMGEGDGLGEIVIEPEHPRDGAGQLSSLDGVSEPGAIVIAFMIDE